MAARKLQVEIDRTMKKINEGIFEFESMMSKVRTAATTNQKDKLEADLKRDIKKLQRLREQVKGWISGTEVKDKAPLQDARKRIETQMEAFKAYEREAKTKAFSKEGLQRQREKEIKGEESGRDISEWLQDRIEELKRQIEVLEGEIESEAGKKKKTPTAETAAHHLERHNFHLDGLEKLLRMWENEAIDRDKVEAIKDDIDYYVDNNQDDDFMENETLYDDLGLDEWDPEALDHEYGDYEVEDGQSDEDGDGIRSSDGTESTAEVASNGSVTASSSSIGPPATSSAKSSAPPATPSASHPSSDGDAKPATSQAPTAPAAATQGQTTTKSERAQSTSSDASSKKSATANPAANSTTTANANATASATATGTANAATPGSTESGAPPVHVTPAMAISTGLTASGGVVSLDPTPAEAARGIRAIPQATDAPQSTSTTSGAATGTTNTLPVGTAAAIAAPLTSSGAIPAPNAGAPGTAITPSVAPSTHGVLAAPLPNSTGQLPSVPGNSTGLDASIPTLPHAALPSFSSATMGVPRMAPPNQRPETEMMELAGLKASARYLPEAEPTRPPYKPRTPASTPSSYPSIPAQNLLDDPAIFQKFPPDLLFFLFYFQQNTYQQYLAARELKRQSWRYHTKYLTWFQRHEDPKTINEQYEQGTYVYFDYETGWCQRKKSEFTFQYVFLEDNELP